jgi:DNA-binding NarL/FixJ family response regulator
MAIIKVLLADDHPALRIGLRVLLDAIQSIEVVAEVEDGWSALEKVPITRPHIAILDCQLPGIDGIKVAEKLRDQESKIRVIALSAYDDDQYLSGMLKAGAVGYYLKSEAPKEIIDAVQRAFDGENLWTADQYARIDRWQSKIGSIRESLTDREREVLHLIAQSLSNKEIAQELSITVRTVDFHVSNILRKLGAVSRVEAAVWAENYL